MTRFGALVVGFSLNRLAPSHRQGNNISTSLGINASTSITNIMPFTVEQLLTVQPPAPPLYPAFDALRRTHSSSSANENYDYIDPADLQSISSAEIASFRKHINSMSPPFVFHSNLTVPFRGTRLMTEGDVTAYLETQVIPAAWETVLLLVPPTDRVYDLLTMRQRNFNVSAVTSSDQSCCR